MQEIWHSVVGYEGLYEVSNMGRVKSINYAARGLPALAGSGIAASTLVG